MRSGRKLVGLATIAVLVFLYVPIVIIFLYAFNADRAQTWPITNWTTHWFGDAFTNEAIREALLLSIEVALAATAVALLLGSLASLAVHRFRFFGRETVSFLLVLPIALPGIVTGMALNATFNTGGIPFGFITIVVGHATFCVVVVYNNVIARLRRSSPSHRGGVRWTWAPTPGRRSATSRCRWSGPRCSPGGLLAFALSFDEVIVTTFTAGTEQTLPDLDPRQPAAAQPAAAGQRRGGGPDHAVGDPGLPVAAAQQRRRRARPARLTAPRRPQLPTSAGRARRPAVARSSSVTIASHPPRAAPARAPSARQPRHGRADMQSHGRPPARTSRVSSHPRSLQGVPDRRSGRRHDRDRHLPATYPRAGGDRPAGAPGVAIATWPIPDRPPMPAPRSSPSASRCWPSSPASRSRARAR